MTMKRRKFLAKSVGVLGAAVGTGLAIHAPNVIAKKRYRWRMCLAIPKTLPIWGEGMVRFAKRVKTLSDGQLDIRVLGAGELVPGLGVFDAVRNGDVQMGHSASYYWMGKVPASPFFSTVPFGMPVVGQKGWIREGGGQKLWDELYHEQGLQGFVCGSTAVQMGGWFRKPINTLADLKGLKMRIPGLGGEVLKKLGGKPMLVPGGEIFSNLSTGVIDATEWVGPCHDYTMGFYKVAKHYYYPGWHEPGAVLELMINKKAWEGLPKDLQELVRMAAQATDYEMANSWPAKDAIFLEKIRAEKGVKISPFPKPVLQAASKAAAEAKSELARTSPLAGKIYSSYTKFQKTFAGYNDVTDFAYFNAQKV